MNIEHIIREACSQEPLEIPCHIAGARHFLIEDPSHVPEIVKRIHDHYALFTLVAVDERLRIARAFKIHYVFSSLERDEFLILERAVKKTKEPTYPSIRSFYPNAAPLEDEIADMYGVFSTDGEIVNACGRTLHPSAYPSKLKPLRRTRRLRDVKERLEKGTREPTKEPPSPSLPFGMFIVPVGPIHASVIEAGHFPFHVAGEVPEELPIRLGYKHRGIEKLFEVYYTLENGVSLAEKVSGDSSFAHSMAYCRAVECLAGVKPPQAAMLWRGVFLELERLYNHIADVGALTHDMAFERPAARIATLREALLQLNEHLGGHRLLRGINRPGGVMMQGDKDLQGASELCSAIVEEFLGIARSVMENPACRDRMLSVGVLDSNEARYATGFVARASGRTKHDIRLQHPRGIYADPKTQEIIRSTIISDDTQHSEKIAPIFEYDLKGDVFARMAIRVAEVETSWHLLEHFFKMIKDVEPHAPLYEPISEALKKVTTMEIGLGYVEGWRGDIVYYLVKGPENSIFRCKVRDPSVFNWHIFPQAVVRKRDASGTLRENLLADFPLINKSFNLSYAGHDL